MSKLEKVVWAAVVACFGSVGTLLAAGACGGAQPGSVDPATFNAGTDAVCEAWLATRNIRSQLIEMAAPKDAGAE